MKFIEQGECIELPVHKGQTYAYRNDSSGRRRPAHRIAWIEERGDLDDCTELHHECGNPACVNLDHLIPVHEREHFYRFHHRVCRNGLHEMTEENILVWVKRGRAQRLCKACKKETTRRAAQSLAADAERLERRRAYRRQWMRQNRKRSVVV